MIGMPAVTAEESRLRQLDEALAELQREQRVETARRVVEDRRRAEFDASHGHQEALERQRAELSARLIEQQTHLRATTEQELMRGRAARLDGDIKALRDKLTIAESERAVIGAPHE